MSSPTLEPIFSTPTPTSDSPSISPPDPAFNSSLPPSSLSIAVPIFTMTLGAVSNILALGILLRSYSRYRRRTKATFLFLASNLVLTDFAGHVIPGAFALRLYAARMQWDSIDRSGVLCQLFGGCMVFFGLCPLFLGGAMAVERCVGLTRPLLHSSVVTSGHGRLAVALLCSLALLVAALPVLNVGRYSRQFPQTWCFLQVHGPLTGAELGLTLVFSGLGLASLAVSLLCNSLSGLALLQARMVKPKACSGTSLDIEMMVQLLGVTLVSCVCWSPFLVSYHHRFLPYLLPSESRRMPKLKIQTAGDTDPVVQCKGRTQSMCKMNLFTHRRNPLGSSLFCFLITSFSSLRVHSNVLYPKDHFKVLLVSSPQGKQILQLWPKV